jgi:hypothetical protein
VVAVLGREHQFEIAAVVSGARRIRRDGADFVFEESPLGCYAWNWVHGGWKRIAEGSEVPANEYVPKDGRPVALISRERIDIVDGSMEGGSARVVSFSAAPQLQGLREGPSFLVIRPRPEGGAIVTESPEPGPDDLLIVGRDGAAIIPSTDEWVSPRPDSEDKGAREGPERAILQLISKLVPRDLDTTGSLAEVAGRVLESGSKVPRNSFAAIAAVIATRPLSLKVELVESSPWLAVGGIMQRGMPIVSPSGCDVDVDAAYSLMVQLHNELASVYERCRDRNCFLRLPWEWKELETQRQRLFAEPIMAGVAPTCAGGSSIDEQCPHQTGRRVPPHTGGSSQWASCGQNHDGLFVKP